MLARTFSFGRRIDLDALCGTDTTLPVVTINGADRATAATSRDQRRTLSAAAGALATLRDLRVAGQAHVRVLPDEPYAPEPAIVDAVIEIRIVLASGLELTVLPHRAGGTAAVAFSAVTQRPWVIDLDDQASAATTMLALTTEVLGDAEWAADHGVHARSARLVPNVETQWRLGLVTDGGYVLSEPNGAVVVARGRDAEGRLVPLTGPEAPSAPDLAQAAAALTRDAAALLMAA
ncbi:hypothetical protein [Actinotalea sp.]|uniref:hypothetical protein n=1 Tax=Actinotalea sp. TaxID=1872145 RepID=UPI003567B087